MNGWTIDRWINLIAALAGVGSFIAAIMGLERKLSRRPALPNWDYANPTSQPVVQKKSMSWIWLLVIAIIVAWTCQLSSCQRTSWFNTTCPNGQPKIPEDKRIQCGYDGDCYTTGCRRY